MRPLSNFFTLLSDDELEMLHDSALKLLEDPGMKIENEELLGALKYKGAWVDFDTANVRFPGELVKEVVEIAKMEEKERFAHSDQTISASHALTFSWHTPFAERTPAVQASLGGGCPMYYNHRDQQNRYATRDDFLRMVNLAEGIPEIVTVGNAVHYLKESDGSDVPPKMVAIKGAETVAKHSSKPGCTSIIDKRQLPYLMEIGKIVKGSHEEYIKRPILVNINDTEPPLRLSRPEAALVNAMARQKISIFILPMPIAGIAGPVFPIANAIVGTAEILGVWTAVKAVDEQTPVEAGCASGVLNPKSGTVSFSAPEANLIDLSVAQLFRNFYGIRCGTGVGIIDAPVPGSLSIFERTAKAFSTALAGEPSFNIGILGGGVVFSPEQVMIDLDIAYSHHHFCRGIGGEHFRSSLDLIRERGIGGLFIDTEHTAHNYRECLWIPGIFERLKSTDVQNALAHDPVEIAHGKWRDILEKTEPYSIDAEKRRAIDRAVSKARDALSSIEGASE